MTKRITRMITAFLAVCLCISAGFIMAPAAAADGEIGKITVRTVKNYDPRVLDSVLDHSTTESSTGGAYTSQATWFDSNGNVAQGLFNEGTYTVEITVYAMDGYSFAEGAAGYINNDWAEVTYVDSRTAVLRRQIGVYSWNCTQVWKNPGDEKVENADDIASFVVSGVYFTDVSWVFTDRDGNTVSLNSASSRFSDTKFEPSRPDENTARLNIRNVPDEMDGWKVHATLSNPTSSANTGKAKIIVVNAQPTPTPTPEPTAVPEEKKNDEATEQTMAGEDVTENIEEQEAHEHFFSAAWKNDENGHWHECQCGEKRDLSAHSMNWTVVSKATGKAPGKEHGICSVCGYTEDREVEYEDDSSVIGKVFLGIIAVIAVILVLIIIEQAKYNRRRKQRQAYKKKYR